MLEMHPHKIWMIQGVITYLPLITQRVCCHLCGHALLIEDPQFPVAGNEMLSYPPTFIMEDFLARSPPPKRERISAS
uniref:Uncharacterized protein n=1 Tax=Cyprinus carpio TaxID=7962 RepID=A0A8C1IMY0_CYPCA